MMPSFPFYYAGNGAKNDTMLFCYGCNTCSVFKSFSDFQNFLLCKFSMAMIFALFCANKSSLFNRVSSVIASRSKKQVGFSYARPVVAFMTDTHSFGNRAVFHNPCNAMRFLNPFSESKFAVTLSTF